MVVHMLGPVHWGSYPGEYLELAMAVLVAQDHPQTLRRTPASGDGGIDLMIPDGDGYEVRQVKRFTGRLGSSEKGQITNSWETFCDDPRLSKPVSAYRVVAPTDLTPDEQQWFDDLVADAPWPVAWLGEVHWHDRASRHPHVIDYFFGGGRDRIGKRSRALQAMVLDPTRALTVEDAAGAIATIQAALNNEDPHYLYEISISVTQPPRDDATGAVLQHTRQLDDGTYLTVRVIAKHRYSLQDSPIHGTLTISVPDAAKLPDLRQKIQAFENFGRVLDLPEGVSIDIVAPGGLGGSFVDGGAWIGPAQAQSLPPFRLCAVSPAGEALAELLVEVPPGRHTVGPAGGAEAHFADGSGAFTGTLRISPPGSSGSGTMNGDVHLDDVSGRPIDEVLPAVRLVAQLHPPNELQVRPQYGNKSWAQAPIPVDIGFEQGTRLHLEDLALVQRYAEEPVLVPSEIDPAFATELHEYARQLRGDVITGTWDEVMLNLTASRYEIEATISGGGALAVDREISMDILGQVVHLGFFTTILHTAVVAGEQPGDQHRIRLVPGEDPTFTRRAGAIDSRGA